MSAVPRVMFDLKGESGSLNAIWKVADFLSGSINWFQNEELGP